MTLAPGCHVSTQKRMLHPIADAAALADDPRDIVRHLEFVGMAERTLGGRSKMVFLLRHPDVDGELFCLRAPKRDVPPPDTPPPPADDDSAHSDVSGDAVVVADSSEAEDDDSDDPGDFDYDDEDVVVLDPAAPAPPPPAPGTAVYEVWAHNRVDLVPDRSHQAVRLHVSGLSEGLVAPTGLFFALFPPSALERIVRASNAHDPSLELTVPELLSWLGLLIIASMYQGPRTSLWVPSNENSKARPLASSCA